MDALTVQGLQALPWFCVGQHQLRLAKGRIMGLTAKRRRQDHHFEIHPESGQSRCGAGVYVWPGVQAMKSGASRRLEWFGGIDFYKIRRAEITLTLRLMSTGMKMLTRLPAQLRSDPQKRVQELSSGMKVKYNRLVLSHNAQLLILMNPPVAGSVARTNSRVVPDWSRKGSSILYSTHITSDLEVCR